MSRVFILGAGASRFAGYPLGLDLWAFVRDSPTPSVKAKQLAKFVIPAMDRILRVVPPKEQGRPNLEELFTLLDLADRGTEILGLKDITWYAVRPCVIGMITETLLWHEYQFQGRVRTNGDRMALRVLDAWTGHLQADDTIITFNWDILHEAALWRAHKWHYADGYGFVCRDAPPRMHSSLKILKLHGSVNWVQASENDCEPAVEYKADFFPPARDDQRIYKAAAEININRGTNLIIPTYLKDVSSNRLLLALWNQASEAIANASELTVVGFQLHPSDALARHLLASALLRNNRLLKVTIVSPREGTNDWARMNYWNDYCRNLGKMSVFYPMTFEEWVLKQA